jgi:hypothetical protein
VTAPVQSGRVGLSETQGGKGVLQSRKTYRPICNLVPRIGNHFACGGGANDGQTMASIPHTPRPFIREPTPCRPNASLDARQAASPMKRSGTRSAPGCASHQHPCPSAVPSYFRSS